MWTIWFGRYFVTYGLITWLPRIYRTVSRVNVATAPRFSLATSAADLARDLVEALSIDRTGRRAWFGLASAAGAAPPLVALWMLGATDLRMVVLCASLSYSFVGSNSLVCYLYTLEIYSPRLRALGTGIATAWLRAGSAVGSVIVGFMLTRYPLRAVFPMFAAVWIVGGMGSAAACIRNARA